MSVRIIKNNLREYAKRRHRKIPEYGNYYFDTFEKTDEKSYSSVFNECYSCIFFDKLSKNCMYKPSQETISWLDELQEDYKNGYITHEEYDNVVNESYATPLNFVELESECWEYVPMYKHEKDVYDNTDNAVNVIAEDDVISVLNSGSDDDLLAYLIVKKISL